MANQTTLAAKEVELLRDFRALPADLQAKLLDAAELVVAAKTAQDAARAAADFVAWTQAQRQNAKAV